MARKPSTTLTEGELKLMKVLWEQGEATVSEVVNALPGRGRPAYNTVLTMLRILEEKGYARHDRRGRAFVYSPVLDRNRAQRTAVRRLVSQFFDDSPASLLLNVIEHERVDGKELARLKKLLKTAK